MIKVDDLGAAHANALAQGLTASDIQDGLHERRFSVLAPGGWPAVFYSAK